MNAPSPSSVVVARYSGLAILLHWVLALAIVGTFCLGLYMSDLKLSPQRIQLFNWHKWIGVSILTLSAVRLLWRWVRRPPALPAGIVQAMPAWQYGAYRATHVLLYALFFVVPLLGWAHSNAAGFPIVWFGKIPLPDLVGKDKALAEALGEAHELAAYVLAVLVVLHAAAALKHQWLDRDGLLLRMMPGGRKA